jgi:hypothetical protein
MERVERAARRLIGEVQVSVLHDQCLRPDLVCGYIYYTVFDLQGLVKTTKYHKWCFDQIQGISGDNKELTAEVDRLHKQLEAIEKNQAELESQRLNAILELSQKERERAGKVS